MNKTIGIIGCGNMGTAILSQSLRSRHRRIKLKPRDFIIFEKDKLKEAFVCQEYHAKPARDIVDLVAKSHVVVIAVKPQDIDGVLDEIGKAVQIYNKRKILLISIAAGIKTRYIEDRIGSRIAVVRAMPNMPASIGEGITALVGGRFADDKDLKIGKHLFEVFGTAIPVEKEELINVVTAISGSGPAYLFYFVMAILEAAKELNLDKDTANKLVYHTISGSMNLLNKENFDAIGLIGKVASKGGTTEAALKIFDESRMNKIILNAIMAAYKRAGELSR